MKQLDPRVDEILTILQEEAAEVIQEVSKIKRFGIDEQHKDGVSHRTKLEMEVGDLQCLIDLLIEHDIVDEYGVRIAKENKVYKLHKYSDIYENQSK